MEVARPDRRHGTLEVDMRHQDTHKEATKTAYLPEAVPVGAGVPPVEKVDDTGVLDLEGGGEKRGGLICGVRRGIFWALIVLLGLCVIVGAVVGGVVGSRNSGGGSEGATGTPTPTSTPDSPKSNYTAPATKLGTVAFDDSTGIHQQRVLYQTNDSVIHEHGWNSTTRAWSHMSDLGAAKDGSPLAISGWDYPWNGASVNVQLASPENFFIEVWTPSDNETTDSKWTSGDLASINLRLADDSDISASWFRQWDCENCDTNIHIFYQDENGMLTHGNSTTDGWYISPASEFPTSAKGTPIAFIQTWLMSGNQTDLMVLYIEENGGIVHAQWDGSREVDDSSLGIHITRLDGGEGATSLAGFAFAPSQLAGGEGFLGLLVSGDDGVTFFVKHESDNEWKRSVPEAMSSLDKDTPVAANSYGHAFGIEKGMVKEFLFSPEGESWAEIGEIVTI